MKRSIILFGVLWSVVMLGGCQDAVNVDNDIQNEIGKKRQSQEQIASSKDLSVISEDVKNISRAINNQNEKREKIIKEEDTKNNKNNTNTMQQSKQQSGHSEENIDMSLAKTCKNVVLKTNFGDITIEFFNNKAPMTVANFCTLSKKGFYDNLTFHRVIKDFMIQGGDPNGNGSGDAGYKFKDEIYSGNSNDEYTIAMANAGPNTNGSQFFINTKANHFLDQKHTVFGKVVKGKDVVDKIEEVETGMADKPVEDVVILDVTIKNE